MKLTKILNLFILLVISCLLVGCAKQKDTEDEEVNVPTTTEEIMDVISKVPGIIYEVDQDTSYLPDGATYCIFATLHNECLVVIHYNSNDNCDKGYDKSKELIKGLTENDNNTDIWKSEIFGRSLEVIVQEGIQAKLNMMPESTRYKLSTTATKIVNKGSNNMIAIVL